MLDEAIAIATAAGDRRTLRLAQSLAALAAVTQGRLEEAVRRSRWTADQARSTGHDTPLITALATLGWALLLQGRPADARAAAVDGLAAARASEEGPVLEGLALWANATVLADADPAGALPMFEEARRLTAPSTRFAALATLAAAEAQLACGDGGGAGVTAEAERLAGEAGCAWLVGRARLVQARLAADPAAAESAVHEGVAQARASGDVLGLINALELLAALAAARGDDQEELRLRGAASAARARQSYAWKPPGTPGRDHDPSAAWAEGEELSIEAAMAYASRGRGRRRRPASGWPSLTPTELEVVRLVARHQSNPEIAERLFVSRATVKTHLLHIFAQARRAIESELAAEAIRRGMASGKRASER